MRGFIDLHCHCVAGIDDGVRSTEEGLELLTRLRQVGFSRVVATPHMRPGLFDNDRESIEQAFQASLEAYRSCAGTHDSTDVRPSAVTASWFDLSAALPQLALSSEHYFDDIVYQRLLEGRALPYPGGRAALLEFWDMELPSSLDRLLARLSRGGLVPVIAHPERYRAIWKNPEALERLLDVGAAALLDTAALVGKYGRNAKKSAELLLSRGLYQAACSDSHRPADMDAVADGMAWIEATYGPDEVQALFADGPARLLEGRVGT